MADAVSSPGIVTSLLNYYKNRKQNSADFPIGQFPNEEHPNYASYQERFTRTPGVVVPPSNLPEDVDAQYTPDKVILSTPKSASNVISHEAAHSLYDQAKLNQHMNFLNSQIDPFMAQYLKTSPIYQREIQQDPSSLSDEALGFSMTYPQKKDEKYVNAAASKIQNPLLRQRLLQLFQHAKMMSQVNSNVTQ